MNSIQFILKRKWLHFVILYTKIVMIFYILYKIYKPINLYKKNLLEEEEEEIEEEEEGESDSEVEYDGDKHEKDI